MFLTSKIASYKYFMRNSNLPVAPRLTPTKERKAKKAFLMALTGTSNAQITDALMAAGVTISQVERWRENDAEFCALERQAGFFKDDILRKQIDNLVDQGDKTIITAAMKRLPEYSPVRKTEVSVSGQVTHKMLAGRPESELDAIIRAGAQLIDADYEVMDTGSIRLPAPTGETTVENETD